MTTNLPLPPFPQDAEHVRLSDDDELAQAAKLERCRQRHENGQKAAFWTGSREGVINTVAAVSLAAGGGQAIRFVAR